LPRNQLYKIYSAFTDTEHCLQKYSAHLQTLSIVYKNILQLILIFQVTFIFQNPLPPHPLLTQQSFITGFT